MLPGQGDVGQLSLDPDVHAAQGGKGALGQLPARFQTRGQLKTQVEAHLVERSGVGVIPGHSHQSAGSPVHALGLEPADQLAVALFQQFGVQKGRRHTDHAESHSAVGHDAGIEHRVRPSNGLQPVLKPIQPRGKSALPVPSTRRDAKDLPEHAREVRPWSQPDRMRDVPKLQLGPGSHQHDRPLQPCPPNELRRGLAFVGLEHPREVKGREVGHLGQCAHGQRLGQVGPDVLGHPVNARVQ